MVHPEATEELKRQASKLGGQAIGVNADVSKLTDLSKLVDEAVRRFGQLDILVNNAGIETRTSVLDTSVRVMCNSPLRFSNIHAAERGRFR